MCHIIKQQILNWVDFIKYFKFKKKKILLSLSVLLVILAGSLYSEGTDFIRKRDVIILFENSLESAAKEAADIYPGVKEELEKTFNRQLNLKPTIFLIKNGEKFKRIVGSDLIVAIAVPERNQIIIDYSKLNKFPFKLRTTLKHELCHLMLHRRIKKGNLPKWLDEGIAQWISGGLGEIIMGNRRPVLSKAIPSGIYINLRDLTKRFPEDEKHLLLAYEESRSLVEYINREFGRKGILNILHYMEKGDSVDEAILKSLSISFEKLEERWHNNLKKEFTWFTYLGNHLYEALFFLGAVLTVCAFIKYLIKKRAYRDDKETTLQNYGEF
ncbi:MAG: peptidase MA family metallohydrolase [Thermodesulfobacteriota bacterium]|nr:peptidase MA family metallohydrolase [Thermodesulfobacteriota bacterium]